MADRAFGLIVGFDGRHYLDGSRKPASVIRILMKTTLHALTLISFLIVGATRANAQLIYDNIKFDPFETSGGPSIGGTLQQSMAFRFTALETLLLDYAKLALWGDDRESGAEAGPMSVVVSIHVAMLENIPAALLESTTVELFPRIVETMPLTLVQFSKSTLLTAGTNYWLAVSPLDEVTDTVWDYTFSPGGYTAIKNTTTNGWYAQVLGNREGGARIFGTPQVVIVPVPEPSTYAVIGALALSALISARVMRRTARRPELLV